MKNWVQKLKDSNWTYIVIILIVGLIIGLPLLQTNIRNTHDGFIHLLRLIGTDDAVKMAQIPPIIAPEYCNGMGYAINLFYPALTCYLPLIIKIFTPTYTLALKIFGIICIILSGFTMYKFVNEVTKKKVVALFAAILYIVAPYKLANVYIRYAIGEFMAAVFIPLVFLGLYNLFNSDGKKHYYITIGAAGLILSHTVSTLYVAIFCAIYVLFFIKKLKEKEILKKCAINIVFIILISAMFVFPMLEASSKAKYGIMDNDIMRTTNEFTSKNTLQFSQFIKDIEEEDGTTFVIGIPMLLLTIVSIYGVYKVDKKYKDTYIIFFIFSMISIIMCTRFFPWKYVPSILCKLQYPWRMLGFFIFFASLLSAINLQWIIEKVCKKGNVQMGVSVIAIIVITVFGLQTINGFIQRDIQKSEQKYTLQGYPREVSVDEEYEKSIMNNKKISHMQINREYLPVKALLLQDTYMKEREDKIYILSGSANINNEQKDEYKLTAQLENIEENTVLELPYIYYPGYKITIENGNIMELKAEESENGYLQTKLEGIESGNIKVEYVGTLITKISYIISILSIMAFILYVVIEKIKSKKYF